jgi:hypothetical protein
MKASCKKEKPAGVPENHETTRVQIIGFLKFYSDDKIIMKANYFIKKLHKNNLQK